MTDRVSNQPGSSPQPRPPIASGKLTKRFLTSVGEGLYIVSNVHDGMTRETATPVFAEIAAPFAEREAQWQRIKAAFADGRNCDVFEDAEHRGEWQRHWNPPAG